MATRGWEPDARRGGAVRALIGTALDVEDGAFTYDYSAPSAGPPPWSLYEVTPTQIFGVLAAEPGGATRWRFED